MSLWALSGFSTLTMELVWMREMALWAGNTVTAATLVTAVFFTFAALGNLLGSRLVERVKQPLKLYSRFEIAAGLVALASLALCRWLWTGHHTAPLLAAVLLAGPASCCSGVAFPCLAQAFIPSRNQRTASAAPFYALNLLGASLGVAAGGVLLPFWSGIQNTFFIGAALQIAGGVAASRIDHASSAPLSSIPGSPAAWFLLAASGLLSLTTQSFLLIWVRQVLEGSIYAVSGVFAVFVGGLGLGALAAAALRRRGHSTHSLLFAFGTASTVLLLLVPFIGTALSTGSVSLRGASPVIMLLEAIGWCLLTLLPLTFSLGGIFPLAWELSGASARGEGRVMGTALGVNKLAAAIGAAGGLFVLLPLTGLAHGTFSIACGYALVAGFGNRKGFWLALPILFVWWQSPPFPGLTPELRLIDNHTGAYGQVTVVEDRRTESRQILLNSRQRLSGTKGALSSQKHQSWVPLLFCRKPERVFTLGMAAGISAAAALDFPIRELQAVELVPEVVTVARDHFAPWNEKLFHDPRARVVTGDGRIELAHSSPGFDAIIADLFFPSEEGSAHLYSQEFFSLARSRLAAGGVFCVWLPCYQHSPMSAGIIARTFVDVFPHAIAVRANFDPLQPVIGFLGSNEPIPISRDHFAARLAGMSFPDSPFLRSPDHAMLLLAGDLHAANPGFDVFAPTTDDSPVFAFYGPREPASKERLHGFPFLDWIGKRFLQPTYPSCDLALTPPETVLDSVRAANFYHAAAASQVVLPGDRRTEEMRQEQVAGLLARARLLSRQSPLTISDFAH